MGRTHKISTNKIFDILLENKHKNNYDFYNDLINCVEEINGDGADSYARYEFDFNDVDAVIEQMFKDARLVFASRNLKNAKTYASVCKYEPISDHEVTDHAKIELAENRLESLLITRNDEFLKILRKRWMDKNINDFSLLRRYAENIILSREKITKKADFMIFGQSHQRCMKNS